MAISWKEILNYKTVGGTIGLATLIFLLLNLSGMTYTIPQSQVCGADCYSEIQVNSSYWNVCVEHSGESKDVVYKKTSFSRNLWLNLDKIDDLISTNPDVKTELLVYTYGNKLRELKDGDCIIKRQTKANPNPSKFVIHGNKKRLQSVEWSMVLGDSLSEDIEVKATWESTKIREERPAYVENDYGSIRVSNEEVVGIAGTNSRYCQTFNIKSNTNNLKDVGFVYTKKLNKYAARDRDSNLIAVTYKFLNGKYYYWLEKQTIANLTNYNWCYWIVINNEDEVKFDVIVKDNDKTLGDSITLNLYTKLDPWASGQALWLNNIRFNASNNESFEKNNTPIQLQLVPPSNIIGNCTKEVRVFECGASGGVDCPTVEQTEITSYVWNETYTGGYCTLANVIHKANTPSLGERGYYVYINRSDAPVANYTDQIYAFENFEEGTINNKSAFKYRGGATKWGWNLTYFRFLGFYTADSGLGKEVQLYSDLNFSFAEHGAHVFELRFGQNQTNGWAAIMRTNDPGEFILNTSINNTNWGPGASGTAAARSWQCGVGAERNNCPAGEGAAIANQKLYNVSIVINATRSILINRTLIRSSTAADPDAATANESYAGDNVRRYFGVGAETTNKIMLVDDIIIYEGAAGNIDPYRFFNTSLIVTQGALSNNTPSIFPIRSNIIRGSSFELGNSLIKISEGGL